MIKEEIKEIKKIKNILSDNKPKDTKSFDILYLIDATGSMANYITAAKEESKNISEHLRKEYPEMLFKYGYIFYRDPIDSKADKHEIIDLTDNVNSLPERIGKIEAYGGGDLPEDWVGAYKLANENISWRDGYKIIMHLADAGAHGKLFTKNDKYPEEEGKLIEELQKCALKNIKIFGYIIKDDSKNSFNECSKIYRSKGGSFEVFNFFIEPVDPIFNIYNRPFCFGWNMMDSNPMMGNMNMMNSNPMMGNMNMMNSMGNMNMMNSMGNMNMMNSNSMMGNMNMMKAPSPTMNMNQMTVNMNFRNNTFNNISNILGKK